MRVTVFSFAVVLQMMLLVVESFESFEGMEGRATLLPSEDASSPRTSQLSSWPANVTACYDILFSSHELKACRDSSRLRYNLTDCSTTSTTSSAEEGNISDSSRSKCSIAFCYALYDQMECFDHKACYYCSPSDSMAFHAAAQEAVSRERREKGGKCTQVGDYNLNRTRCFPGAGSLITQVIFTSGDSFDLSYFLVMLICCLLALALLVVSCMMLQMYLTGSCCLLEESSTRREKRRRISAKSTKKSYGPADFMDPKSKRRSRLASLKSSQLKSQVKKTSLLSKENNNKRTSRKGRLSLKSSFKMLKSSKVMVSQEQS